MEADRAGRFVDIPHDAIDKTTNKHLLEELKIWDTKSKKQEG